jgi:hypothetical protein
LHESGQIGDQAQQQTGNDDEAQPYHGAPAG